jgi:hypothetical protein
VRRIKILLDQLHTKFNITLVATKEGSGNFMEAFSTNDSTSTTIDPCAMEINLIARWKARNFIVDLVEDMQRTQIFFKIVLLSSEAVKRFTIYNKE